MKDRKALIIPMCTDFNRGDQALVFETAHIIKDTYNCESIYMMSTEDSDQCKKEGLKVFGAILKHPSRYTKKNNNIRYSLKLKIKWGIIACFDFLTSILILNNITRPIGQIFLSKEAKATLELYKSAEVCFVKGGGFLHDYSGGLIGLYTTYFQTFHIRLAQKLNVPVYIMPNSYGPFKNNKSAKMINKILDKCEIVTARESISADKERNGLGRDIPLYPDLAFFLEQNDKFDVNKYFEKLKISLKEKYVGITVRPYRFDGYENPEEKYKKYKVSVKDFVLWLNEKGYKPLFVVQTRAENDHENDEKCIQEILDMIKDTSKYEYIKDDDLSCREIKKIYGKCKYIIGTRFHSVIFSITQGIPAISITYGGNKGDGIMKDSSSDKYSIKIDKVTFESLKDRFEDLEENKEKSIESINKYLEQASFKRQELVNNIKQKMEEK